MDMRALVLDDLRSIDEDHLWMLGLVVREPHELRNRRTPSNEIPFAGSMVDSTIFGFLVEDHAIETLEAITDLAVRPVCVRQSRAALIVPDLRSFLSLVSLSGAEAIGQFDTDDAWRRQHEDCMSDPELRAASEALRRLPGVSVPAAPCSLVTRASPPLPRPAPSAAGVAGAVALWQQGKHVAAETALRRQITTMLTLGDRVHADRWRELHAALVTTGVNLDEDVWTQLRAHGVVRPK